VNKMTLAFRLSGSFKVIERVTDRSGTYDFLLVITNRSRCTTDAAVD